MNDSRVGKYTGGPSEARSDGQRIEEVGDTDGHSVQPYFAARGGEESARY